jgi:DNA mismatch repair protein MutL
MAIQALPQCTVRLLGSSMKITSPCDVVKELLDNAMDARATAVEVTIAPNTVDRISVKDNGIGIDVEDFSALGRRAHTSKLREYSELANIGRTSLGFRGEALAGVNAVANVTITTKRSGDPIAWKIELIHSTGGVKERRPVSATVGTTVAVTKLFENLPPRKHHVLKNGKKGVTQIQKLLKAYAFAQPSIKMSLKIVGDSKPAWSYAPQHPNPNREAILQILGTDVLANCIQIHEATYENRGTSTQTEAQEQAQWQFTGYIPKSNHSLENMKDRAIFLSIDKRPMSRGWHITKRLVSILESHLSRTSTSNGGKRHSGLFLQLDIKCSNDSYDPNITAMKDELLIFSEKGLLDGFDLACKRAYATHNQALQSAHPTATPELQPDSTPGDHLQHVRATIDKQGSLRRAGAVGSQHGRIYRSQDWSDNSGATQPMTKAQMKVAFKVNMERGNNDDSEEDESDAAVEVEIPRLPPIRDNQPDNGERQRSPRGNIRQYFHPIPKANFKIACDSTETEIPRVENFTNRQLDKPCSSERSPLQPLSENALNRIRDEAESGPELPAYTSPAPRMARTVTRDDPTPSLHQIADAARQVAVQGMTSRNTHVSQPNLSYRETNYHQRDSLLHQVPSRMLTPPPSDPRHGSFPPGLRPGFRPRLDGASLRGTMTAQQRRAEPQNRDESSFIRGSEKCAVACGVRSGQWSPVGAMARFSQDRPSSSEHNTRRLAVPFAASEGPHFNLTTEPVKSPTGISGGRTEACQLPEIPPVPMPRPPHSNQHCLTLSSIFSYESQGQLAREPTVSGKNDTGRKMNMAAFVLDSETSRYRSRRNGAGQDSRPNYVQRQRSRTRHGQVRQLSSQGLPLEDLDTKRQTLNLCATSSQQSHHIQQQMDQHSDLESYITYGRLTTGLPFQELRDIDHIETKLQQSIRSWMKKGGIPGQVEYILRSEAKGKCRAE